MDPPAAITALLRSFISGSVLSLRIKAFRSITPLTLRTQFWPVLPDLASTARKSGAILLAGDTWACADGAMAMNSPTAAARAAPAARKPGARKRSIRTVNCG